MNDIEAILKATIQTKVIEAFNQTPDMIEKLVQGALSKDVNENGQPPSSSRYNEETMPYMDWLVGNEIRMAVHEVVRDHVATNKVQIREKVENAIGMSDFARPLGETIAKVLSEDWRWSVDLKIEEDK